MVQAEEILDGIPLAFRFRPTQRELVEFYLLPRARGQNPFRSVIIEDDTAGSSLPWDLYERHGLGSEDEAYFFVRTSDAKKPGARQDRACDGGVGSWKMQSSLEKGMHVGGEKIRYRKSNLNLHMGKGKNGGSVGWVMHEYTIAAPPCPSLVKVCHIAFTGHGRKRERVPGGQEDCQSQIGQVPQVDATAVGGYSGGMLDPDSGALVYASADEESLQPVLTKNEIFSQNPALGGSEFLGFQSTASANAEQYQDLEQEVPSNLWSSTWFESNNMVPRIGDNVVRQLHRVQEDYQTGQASSVDATAEAGSCSGAMLDTDSRTVVYVSADEERSQPVLTDDIFSQSPLLDSSNFLGFLSASSANAEQYQDLEQEVRSNLWSSTWFESNNVVPRIADNMVRQFDRVQEDYQTGQASQVNAAAAAGGCSGADAERLQLVLTEDIFYQSPLLDSSDFLGFPSASSANAEQYQDLEQEVPSTEEQQAMMPQLTVQQSVTSLEEQLCAGELEYWSSSGVDIQSSNLGGNLWSPTGVDVQGSNDFADQDFWNSTVVESDSVVPHIGDMAEGQQDQQEDFWSSSGTHVQNNCAMPDMAARVAANCHWGGYRITC